MEAVLPHVSRVDMVLVMTAEPGVEGQDGVVNPEHKVETLQQKYPNLLIRTDGWEQLPKEQVSSFKIDIIFFEGGGGGG